MSSKWTASPAVLAHNFRVARRITFDSQDHAGYSVGQFQSVPSQAEPRWGHDRFLVFFLRCALIHS